MKITKKVGNQVFTYEPVEYLGEDEHFHRYSVRSDYYGGKIISYCYPKYKIEYSTDLVGRKEETVEKRIKLPLPKWLKELKDKFDREQEKWEGVEFSDEFRNDILKAAVELAMKKPGAACADEIISVIHAERDGLNSKHQARSRLSLNKLISVFF